MAVNYEQGALIHDSAQIALQTLANTIHDSIQVILNQMRGERYSDLTSKEPGQISTLANSLMTYYCLTDEKMTPAQISNEIWDLLFPGVDRTDLSMYPTRVQDLLRQVNESISEGSVSTICTIVRQPAAQQPAIAPTPAPIPSAVLEVGGPAGSPTAKSKTKGQTQKKGKSTK